MVSAFGLEVAFKTERASLLQYLGRRAGNEAAADLVQEVFMRAASSDQASRLINPAAFIRRIARNLLIDRARRQKRDNVVFFPIDEQRDLVSLPQQSWNLEAADLLRLYESAVETLPEKTRRVFLMHRVDDLSYREIHDRLGISIATVEYHMIKAIAHIGRHVDAAR
ncbi:RNA polymerase sigma factor [Sphingobium sp. BS19]|uniref:RNA polymerase sigma factor n=1 Tax=Sphingobium sp. BS19 TaxID=3018973 RepID=UPI00248F7344|nr:sigma-70 family RNA polymerase sigma factor [Sphingobium sp. BS19]